MHLVWSWGSKTWQKSEPDDVVVVVDVDADEDDVEVEVDVEVDVDVIVTVWLLVGIGGKPPGPSVGSSGKKHFASFWT